MNSKLVKSKINNQIITCLGTLFICLMTELVLLAGCSGKSEFVPTISVCPTPGDSCEKLHEKLETLAGNFVDKKNEDLCSEDSDCVVGGLDGLPNYFCPYPMNKASLDGYNKFAESTEYKMLISSMGSNGCPIVVGLCAPAFSSIVCESNRCVGKNEE